MKKIRFDRIIVISLIIIIAIIAIFYGFNQKSEYEQYNHPKDNKNYGQVQRYFKDTVDFYTSIYYPKFNIKDLDESIIKMYEDWLKEENALPSKDVLHMDYSANIIYEQYLNLRFKYQRIQGNKKVIKNHEVLYTYDIKNKKILKIEDVFRNTYNLLFNNVKVTADTTSFHLTKDSFKYYEKIGGEAKEYLYEKIKQFIKLENKKIPSYIPSKIPKKGKQISVEKNKKLVAFTFDDGPNSKYTLKIMEVLKKHKGQATFFVPGKNVEANPKIIKELYENGFEIANKPYSNQNLTKLADNEIEEEVQKTQDAIFKVIGTDATLIRPPFAASNPKIKSIFKKYNLKQIIWSMDSFDWKLKNGQKVAEQVLKTVNEKYIVLMHDSYEFNIEALDMILTTLENQGYQFVNVSTLLENQEY